jgi:hypothetical protein
MFNFFKKKKEPENLKEVLEEFSQLKKEFEILKEKEKFNIQKVGIIRFNPFKELGGNQSFSIALLDGKDDGIVITSLYTREGNRVFAKPIKNGNSEYPLLEEEKEAINLAKNERKNPKLNPKATSGGNFGAH